MDDPVDAMRKSMEQLLRRTDIGEEWIWQEIMTSSATELKRRAAKVKQDVFDEPAHVINRSVATLNDVRLLADDMGKPTVSRLLAEAMESAFALGVFCRAPEIADRLLKKQAGTGGSKPRATVKKWREEALPIARAERERRQAVPRLDITKSVRKGLLALGLNPPGIKQIDNYLDDMERAGRLEAKQTKK